MSEITKEENAMENVGFGAENAAEAKFKRTVVALTVGAVVFLCVLIILMCYQLIKIGVENRRKAEYNAKITELTEQLKDGEEELAYRRTSLFVERMARKYGYRFPDDIN